MCPNRETRNNNYYLKTVKFIRDLVHGYVYLTQFDLDLIDTVEFQRLKDIRQLTCQQLYPAARHTRFEHSLGVMELTRQVIRSLNQNGFLFESLEAGEVIFNEQLQFNAALAALLHDIGHCPFSHLGEGEFDKDAVWNRLCNSAKNCPELQKSPLLKELNGYNHTGKKKPAATHEQMSCIMILENFYKQLSDVQSRDNSVSPESILSVDFELLIRAILGLEYDTSTSAEFEKSKEKNVIVRLINSHAFDMDKLDYIIRDSYFTGIGVPQIDTRRLFRNIYLSRRNEYSLVFSHRAVPALQNMIEDRDGLYMYVYNHHTVIYSDFMNSYIFRRLAHNEKRFLDLCKTYLEAQQAADIKAGEEPIEEAQMKSVLEKLYTPVIQLGIVSKDYLFVPEAILEQKRSDSDLLSLLSGLNYNMGTISKPEDSEEVQQEKWNQELQAEVMIQLLSTKSWLEPSKLSNNDIKEQSMTLISGMKRTHTLISRQQQREYLKPWWKSNAEFNSFINTNFKDERVRQKLCDWICNGYQKAVPADEFRSQLAKNVTYITRYLWRDKQMGKLEGLSCDLVASLGDDEFFVIERSARFFDPATIGELDIAMKSNEMLSSPSNVKYQTGDYYIKTLNNVIPQRDYYSMYAKNSFYVFLKKQPDDGMTTDPKRQLQKHYRLIEKIFVFVAAKLIQDGPRKFEENYGNRNSDAGRAKEQSAHEEMYDRFLEAYT